MLHEKNETVKAAVARARGARPHGRQRAASFIALLPGSESCTSARLAAPFHRPPESRGASAGRRAAASRGPPGPRENRSAGRERHITTPVDREDLACDEAPRPAMPGTRPPRRPPPAAPRGASARSGSRPDDAPAHGVLAQRSSNGSGAAGETQFTPRRRGRPPQQTSRNSGLAPWCASPPPTRAVPTIDIAPPPGPRRARAGQAPVECARLVDLDQPLQGSGQCPRTAPGLAGVVHPHVEPKSQGSSRPRPLRPKSAPPATTHMRGAPGASRREGEGLGRPDDATRPRGIAWSLALLHGEALERPCPRPPAAAAVALRVPHDPAPLVQHAAGATRVRGAGPVVSFISIVAQPLARWERPRIARPIASRSPDIRPVGRPVGLEVATIDR